MIALITPTGARRDQFDICQKLMYRQTYTEKVLWIIVDDAVPNTTDQVKENFRANWIIEKTYPRPPWMRGQNTQGRNICAGLDVLQNKYDLKDIQCIFIIEDDDYYRPTYLERMIINLGNHYAVGEQRTIYYNVIFRKYIVNANTIHASLFQTGFTPQLIPVMRNCQGHKFIDAEFWKRATNKYLFKENDLGIGIKGMPGRAGIGAGHGKLMNMHPDNDLKYLKRLIGDDTKFYEKFYAGYSQQRYDLLNRKRR